jgi:L-rhamnose isomerase/sugar isomerase
MEAMVQSVVTAQELFARAALVDRTALTKLQDSCQLVEAEECYRDAFWTDVRPAVAAWREDQGLPANPLKALRESGYVEQAAKDRGAKNAGNVASYA